MIADRRADAVAVMKAGVESGEIRSDIEFDLVFELFVGAWMAHYALAGAVEENWAERVVGLIWPSIAATD
jgi:hypothetical protein